MLSKMQDVVLVARLFVVASRLQDVDRPQRMIQRYPDVQGGRKLKSNFVSLLPVALARFSFLATVS